ncbi:hypothetical protein [Aerococcus sp. L_32]|uniref:hypothetical protein n=1 Tax=Aerococcus sp. L_32 TaxID=3422316 RepID=UPI003D6A7468
MKNINIERESSDYIEALEEQLEFLINNCKMFDSGNFKYAKQIATNIRVLVHDTKTSQSLLQLLNRKESMKFLTTVSSPKNVVFQIGLVIPVEVFVQADSNQYISEPWFIPTFTKSNNRKWVSFDTWYSQNVLTSAPTSFSRKKLITYVANKDGGAHIDKSLPEDFYQLSKGISSMLYRENGPLNTHTYEKGEPFKYLHLSSIRQIAHELILSLRKEFGLSLNYNPTIKSFTNQDIIATSDIIMVKGVDKIEYNF